MKYLCATVFKKIIETHRHRAHREDTNNSITAIPIIFDASLERYYSTKVKIYLATNDTNDASHLTRIYS
jgi:hypothetical protein